MNREGTGLKSLFMSYVVRNGKKRGSIVSVLFAIALMSSVPVRATEALVFAPMPVEAPETVVGQWHSMLDRLAQVLGVPIRIEYAASHSELLALFRAGKVDLAHLGPLPYVTLKEQFSQVEPIVNFREPDGQTAYTCALFALDERRLSPHKIVGMKVALTQPLSTCGYLMIDRLLRLHGSGLEKNRYRYLGQHDTVAIAVARGDFDAGGAKTSIVRKYTHLGPLRKLRGTAKIPQKGNF